MHGAAPLGERDHLIGGARFIHLNTSLLEDRQPAEVLPIRITTACGSGDASLLPPGVLTPLPLRPGASMVLGTPPDSIIVIAGIVACVNPDQPGVAEVDATRMTRVGHKRSSAGLDP